MTLWLKRLRDAFRAWLKANQEAYAKSKPPFLLLGCAARSQRPKRPPGK
jgi:hypothetical protein